MGVVGIVVVVVVVIVIVFVVVVVVVVVVIVVVVVVVVVVIVVVVVVVNPGQLCSDDFDKLLLRQKKKSGNKIFQPCHEVEDFVRVQEERRLQIFQVRCRLFFSFSK